jgi:hypothetical protein
MGRSVKALAVDNEPSCFWNGSDEKEQLEEWLNSVEWETGWGEANAVPSYNGSSGRRVDEEVLRPLNIDRSEVWLTDCLNTYHASPGVERR